MRISGASVGFVCLLCLLFCSCDEGKEEARCGNGVIEAGEGCDGQAMPARTCQDFGFTGGTLSCSNCSLIMTGCTKCGDYYLDPGEQCDKDDLNGQTCLGLGHQGGELACADDCTFDDSACHDWLPLTVVITGYSEQAGEDAPLEGAAVVLDAPSGERFEQSTDADGRTTFSDIDWTQGYFTLTAYMEGYRMLTYVGLDLSAAGEEAVRLSLPSLTPPSPESLTLSGTLSGTVDPAHYFAVNVVRSPVATEWQGTGDRTWGVRVPRGQPFTVQGIEFSIENLPSGRGYSMPIHQVAHQDFSAIDVNTSGAVLDFGANAVTLHTADTWFPLPSRLDSPLLSGSGACWIFEGQSLYSIGWAELIDISPDGTQFDTTFVWAEPAWAEGVRVCCQVLNQQGLGSSVLYMDGYPQAGEMDGPLDVPRWVAPANPTMAHPLGDPLEWELFDAGAQSQLSLVRGTQNIWAVLMGPDTESLTLPALPSTVDPATFLGTAPLTASLFTYNLDEAGERIMRYSAAQAILLAP